MSTGRGFAKDSSLSAESGWNDEELSLDGDARNNSSPFQLDSADNEDALAKPRPVDIAGRLFKTRRSEERQSDVETPTAPSPGTDVDGRPISGPHLKDVLLHAALLFIASLYVPWHCTYVAFAYVVRPEGSHENPKCASLKI